MKRLGKKIMASLLAMSMCLSMLPANALAAEANVTLDLAGGQFVIMSTTDVHGKVWDENILNDTTVNNSLLNASTAVSKYREEYGKDNVILLDNGDLYQGTPISSYNISQYTQGKTTEINPLARALAYMNYDAAILGNHEFNYPWETMSDIYDYLDKNDVKTVCANLYDEATGKRVFDPYLIKEVEVDGQKVEIGIIGLENTDCSRWDVSDNYPGMIFAAPENKSMDLSYEVQKVQDEWKAAGIDPDFVLVCYHGALESEKNATDALTFGVNTENQVRRIITNTTGIDMVISGHDHNSSYSNNTYKNKAGEDVLVVNGGGTQLTASVWNVSVDKATGEASVSLDDVVAQDLSEETAETTISLESSKNLDLSAYEKDSSLKEIIKPYVDTAKEYVNTAVGKLLNWDGKKNSNSSYYLEQTDTVDLINRAQISEGGYYLNEKYTSVDKLNAKLREIYGNDTKKQLDNDALLNGKLVVDLTCTSVVTSSPLPSEGDSELSMKGIYGFYKYDNSLYLITLTGAEIKEFIEYNASDRVVAKVKNGEVIISDTGDYNANFTFPVFYGLNYEIDMSAEVGNRVNITGFSNGKTFSEDEVYIFGINNYHIGNTANAIMSKYSTSEAIWSQTDDLGGGYVQDLIADYVGKMTEEYGGVYASKEADKNGEGICTWDITWKGEIPTDVTVSDNTAYVGTRVDELTDGAQVMLVNVANENTISTEYYSESTPTLAAAGASNVDGKIYAETGTALYTVGVTEEGYYTFKTELGYLTSKSTGSGLGYETELNEYGLWELVETEEEGVFYLKNINATYGGYSAQYLEYYYGKFTTYGLSGGGDPYGVSFYSVKTSGAQVKANKIADGDNLVIYYNNGETVFGPVNGNKLSAVKASVVGTDNGSSVVAPEDGATVFKVGVTEDGKYTFSTSDGYLTYSKGLTYKEELTDNGLWELEETADGYYYIRNVGAHDQYVEFYNGFTTYKMSGNTALYTFTLYKVGAVASADETEVEGYSVSLFETSDVHGYLLDSSSGNEDTYQYRLAYIADKVNDARALYEEDNVILIDSGDIYQGNVISNLQNGQPMTAAYDLMQYDAVSIGNHEFDWGYETVIDEDGTMSSYAVGEYEGDSEVPVIASNIYKDGEKVDFAHDYVILEKDAVDEDGNAIKVKIGVIGFVDDYAADIMAAQFTGRGFTVDENYEELEKLAAYLETEMGCDATVALCHADAGQVVGNLSKNSVIDLVCGGHSHSAQSGKTNGVAYMEPSNQAATYGYAELVFQTEEGSDEVTGVTVVSPKTISVTNDKTKLYDTEENAEDLDQDIVALSKASVENVSDVMNEKIGYITSDVTKAAIEENNYSSAAGNWLTSQMARAVGAEVGLTNNGGIRTEFALEEGTDLRYITAGDIYSISPFCNIIYGYEITYADLLSVMEYMIGSGSALGLRMSGIDCYYTGNTVTALVLSDGTLIYESGNWVGDYASATVKVATNEYIATSDTPFKAWNDTDKLYSNTIADNEGQIAVLKEEAAKNHGYLYVDTNAHMINGTYSAENYADCDHGDLALTFDPTCTEDGYTIHICEKCGHYTIDSTVKATGHDYQDGVCTVCGKEESASNPDSDDQTGGNGAGNGTGNGNAGSQVGGNTTGNTNKDHSSAATGDTSNVMIYMFMMACAAMMVCVYRKKKSE